MTVAVWTYCATVIGLMCSAVHLGYCRAKHNRWPPVIRLLATFLAGAGTISGVQLAAIVASPPTVPPATIRVDDFRIVLGIGVLAMFASSVWALYDNWRAMAVPEAGRKDDRNE